MIEFFDLNPQSRQIKCTLHCDSKAALQRAKDLGHNGFGTTWRCRANYDLEAAIRKCITDGFFTVDWKWVKGHASRRKERLAFTCAEETAE